MVYGMVYILCIQQILIMTKLLKSSEETPLVTVACTVSSTNFLDEPTSSFLLNGIKHDQQTIRLPYLAWIRVHAISSAGVDAREVADASFGPGSSFSPSRNLQLRIPDAPSRLPY
jgi:hypothetical protein